MIVLDREQTFKRNSVNKLNMSILPNITEAVKFIGPLDQSSSIPTKHMELYWQHYEWACNIWAFLATDVFRF